MANKDLELALRIKADLEEGRRALQQLGASVSDVGDQAVDASTKLNTVGESADQQTARIRAMVAASLEQQSALNGVETSTQRVTQAAAAGTAQWQQTAAAQNAAMAAAQNTAAAQDKQASTTQRTATSASRAKKEIGDEGAALAKLLGQIDPVVAALDRLDDQERQLRAARASGRLDVDTFDVYNAKLTEQRTRLSGTNAAMKASAITAGQYQQAMRQLPMQLTDITTSLASGMPVWMVAIQQGGQIKDSFGGAGNAARALASVINPLTLAIAAIAVSTTALVVAYQQGSREAYEFEKALILSGNAAGTNADQLTTMAQAIDGISGTQRQASAALAQIAGTGKFTADQIREIGTTAVLMENNVGKAVSETVAEFARLADDPTKAAAELNAQYHFLTAAVYEQIRALQDQGDEAAAAQLAIDTFAGAMKSRANEIHGNLGLIERAWGGIKTGAAEAWDAMLGIGRQQTLEEQLAALDNQQRAMASQAAIAAAGAPFGAIGAAAAVTVNAINTPDIEAERERLQLAIKERDAKAVAQAAEAKQNQDSIAAQAAIAAVREQSLTKVEQKEKAITEYRANVEKIRAADPASALISDDKVAADIAAIEKRYAEAAKKKPKTTDTELKNQQSFVAQLERQAATFGKNADEVRQYELAEKNLTGTLQQRAAAAIALLDVEEKKRQADADAKQLVGIQAQLLAAQGNGAAAVGIQIEQQYGELIERLRARSDQAGLDLVNNLINVEQAKAQLGELETQIDRVFAEQSRQENQIQAQQQAGLISEIGARQQIVDLHARTAAEIEKLLPQMQQLAAATGDPAAIERLKDLQAQLEQTKFTANELTNAFRSGFEDGLAGALQGLAQGTMDLREAATSFVSSIAGSLSQLASQKLAAMAFDNMFGSVLQTAPQAVTAIGTVAAAKTAADTTMTASGATAAAASTATQVEAATATTAAWTPASIAASIGSWGAAAAIGLAAVVAALAFKAFAKGGHVRGPGSTTSDSIPALLSDQEFVTRAAVVTQPGALPFLDDFNRRGMAALADWSGVVRHATGGLAGVPAPSMPTPGRGATKLADPAASSTTLKNAQNFYLVDDPQRIVDAAFNSRAGEQALVVAISRDPGKFRSILNING